MKTGRKNRCLFPQAEQKKKEKKKKAKTLNATKCGSQKGARYTACETESGHAIRKKPCREICTNEKGVITAYRIAT